MYFPSLCSFLSITLLIFWKFYCFQTIFNDGLYNFFLLYVFKDFLVWTMLLWACSLLWLHESNLKLLDYLESALLSICHAVCYMQPPWFCEHLISCQWILVWSRIYLSLLWKLVLSVWSRSLFPVLVA